MLYHCSAFYFSTILVSGTKRRVIRRHDVFRRIKRGGAITPPPPRRHRTMAPPAAAAVAKAPAPTAHRPDPKANKIILVWGDSGFGFVRFSTDGSRETEGDSDCGGYHRKQRNRGRRRARQGVSLYNPKGNIAFITFDTAKSLVNGDAYPSIRWDARNKSLLHDVWSYRREAMQSKPQVSFLSSSEILCGTCFHSSTYTMKQLCHYTLIYIGCLTVSSINMIMYQISNTSRSHNP